jgi:uncharacterized protein (TIGR04551 family)
MRLSSIVCLLVLLGLPAVSWAQAGSPQTPGTSGAAGAPAEPPAVVTPNAGEGTPSVPSEPDAASANTSESPATAGANSAPSEPGSAATDAPAEPASNEALAPPAAADAMNVPSPGELSDRLVGDLPPAPEQKSTWTAPTPIITLHGYVRTRGEMYDRFWLGRSVSANDASLAAQGPDPFSRFRPLERSVQTTMCGDEGTETDTNVGTVCKVKTLQFANMRFRFSPQLNISEDIRIKTTFDILDNYVLGEGPRSFYGSGTAATAAFPGTNIPTSQLIVPRRVWAEVRNRDLGELRFGLMPEQWGLGMLYNAGNGLDDDFSTDLGRVMGTTKLIGFYLSAAYDFMSEGTTANTLFKGLDSTRPDYDISQLEDLDQFTFSVVRRFPDEDEETVLERGDMVINSGAHFQLRHQDSVYANPDGKTTPTLQNLNATMYTPDLWGQLRWGKLRLELEAAWVVGHLTNLHDPTKRQHVSEFGAAFESELRLFGDKLGLYFYTGGATGDSETEGLSSDANFIDYAGQNADATLNNSRVSTFRFHPSYHVDLILWRNIMGAVTGAYYFKPGVSYDFLRDAFGQLFGARLDMIYSRASSPVQTWGNDPNLGIELDGQVYWRSADGPNSNNGYHAMLQYGVLFPLRGLGYVDHSGGVSTAQVLRLVLGVMF